MKFVLVSPGKLKVTLSAVDLEEFSISYDAMDYTHNGTRQLLVDLLEQGKLETGFNPQHSKLYIEVYPTEEDGMVIYFTTLPSGHQLRKGSPKAPAPVIFSFEDIDDLTHACCKVYARYSHRIYKSSLYKLGKQWRLIVYPLDYADQLSVYFLSEFAPQIGEGEIHAAYVQEHGQEIILDTALDTLAKYFGQAPSAD